MTTPPPPLQRPSVAPKTVRLRPWKLQGYQPIGRIANGGMAEVWLARHLGAGGFERLVAVKRLHAHHAAEKTFVQMFLHEARLAAFIHHPNVVPIHATSDVNGDYYLVMDYVEGPTVSRLRHKASEAGGFIPSPVVSRIMLDTLSGLHAAHDATDHLGSPMSLIHRDCTPQNILVGVEGSARLTDFGVARARARLESSQDGTLKGKLSYLAPEQATETDLDRRVDLFSAGAVLWELYSGQRLFLGDTEAGTLAKVLKMPIPRLVESRPELHPGIDKICRRALARNRDKRFSSALAMAEAIEQVAKASDGIATRREVANYIQHLVGRELERRRFHVQNWIRATPRMKSMIPAAQRPSFSLPPSNRAMSQLPQAPSQFPGPSAMRPPPIPKAAPVPKISEPYSSSTKPEAGLPPPVAPYDD